MDDIERVAACKIIDTFRNAPELKLDSSQFKLDCECETEDLDELERKNPIDT